MLFPTVAETAAVLQWAAVIVGPRFLVFSPGGAPFSRVVVDVDFATVVLPVVGVDTHITCMVRIVLVAEGTPNCLEVEHVEVRVALHLVQLVD